MTARSRAVRLPERGTVEDLLGGCPRSLVYSTAEQRYCGRRTDLTGWGGRLAAKLAIADLLGIDADTALAERRDAGLAGIQILPARSGLCRHGPGCLRSHPPEVSLTSALREDNDVSVSISHTRAWAVALAVSTVAVRSEREG